jgi:serine/threonine-protein kinase
VLYELFTGKRVYESNNLHDLMKLHQTSAPTSPSSHVKDIDPLVEKVILRCLEKDPSKRPSSAIQVAAALPGGDPLAAALAAGETPSPEMVAAAKTETGLRPAVAITLAASALLMLVAVLVVSDSIGMHYKIPFEKSPDALHARAVEIIKQSGYANQPTDYAIGFEQDGGYFDYLTRTDSSAQRWDKLATGQPAFIQFWYRQSPNYLLPFNRLGNVSKSDPPQTAPGMTSLVLDTRGRLIKFFRVPPQASVSGGPAITPNWSVLFDSAGLDISRFTPTESQWNPPDYSDMRSAWLGAYPDHPEIPLRIEAAAYQGKPTYFALIGPWEQPALEKPQSRSIAQRISTTAVVVVGLSVFVGGLLLARRNLKLGRGDRKGAFRFALFVMMLEGVYWLTRPHVPEISAEWDSFISVLAFSLFRGGVTWLVYIALEPLLRRRWPNLVISWNRLLAGNYRDPLIGRDLLIGSVCGVGIWVVNNFPRLLLKLTGNAYPLGTFFPPVRGLRSLINQFAGDLGFMLFLPMALLFLCLLVSAVVRKPWLAAIVVWLLLVANFVPARPSLIGLFSTAVTYGVLVIVTMRYGLLPACFCFLIFRLMANYPTTANFSAWYAEATIFVLIIAVGLILFGFYTSLAGQQLFRSKLLNE